MTFRYDDRIKVTTSNPGTAAFPYNAAAVTGFNPFTSIPSITNGDTVPYWAYDGGSLWETGFITYSTSSGLVRSQITRNSAGNNSAINFNTGIVTVACDLIAASAVMKDASGNVTLAGGLVLNGTISGSAILPAAQGGAGTVTGILKANGSGVVSAAVASTDFAPATTGSSILYANGSGGFANLTIGTNLSFTGTTLNASSAPVSSVAGRTGAVTLAYADISGLNTAAQQPTSAFDAAGAAATAQSNAETYAAGVASTAQTNAEAYTNSYAAPLGGSGASGTWGINITGNAANITAYTINQSVGSGNAPTFTGLTINGAITATGEITGLTSDDRLKNNLGKITGALAKVLSLDGFYYEDNDLAVSLGIEKKRRVGVSAQQVQAIFPDENIVAPAPIDNNYLTVRYERLVPLLIEAIKELAAR